MTGGARAAIHSEPMRGNSSGRVGLQGRISRLLYKWRRAYRRLAKVGTAKPRRGTIMETSEIAKRVLKIIAGAVGNAQVNEISTSASLMDELGLDSLDVADVQIQLEEEFDIEIANRDAEAAHTVQDVIDIVKRHLDAKAK
jgi:acyl carrier protein